MFHDEVFRWRLLVLLLIMTFLGIIIVDISGLTDTGTMLTGIIQTSAKLRLGIGSYQWAKHDVYRKSLDPDNWQTVKKNVSYVYSAHLHPDSNETVSVVQVLGTLIDREYSADVNYTFRKIVQCKLWSWPRARGAREPTVTLTRVSSIVQHCNKRR